MCLLRGTDWVFIYSSTFCPHSVFMCFVWIWEQTAIISLYSINWLVFVTEMECVYCAVRTGSLNVSRISVSVFKRLAIRNLFSTSEVFVQHLTVSSRSNPVATSRQQTDPAVCHCPPADDRHSPSMNVYIHNSVFSVELKAHIFKKCNSSCFFR